MLCCNAATSSIIIEADGDELLKYLLKHLMKKNELMKILQYCYQVKLDHIAFSRTHHYCMA